MSIVAETRRRHRGRTLLIVVLIVLVLLVILDRVGVAVAENQAAKLLQSSQDLDRTPDVDITGFPFLTQVIAGTYPEIDVTANDLTVGHAGTQLRIAHLRVVLHDVHVSRDFSSARSDSASAMALITYPDLSTALGAPVSYSGDGRIHLTYTVNLGGVPITATATAATLISGGALTFVDPQISVAGQAVPSSVNQHFATVLQTSIPLAGLPFGVQVNRVAATDAGLSVALTARGLTYHR